MLLQKERNHVVTVLKEAGAAALAIQADAKNKTKADGSPVSDGDRIANDIIINGLKRAFPEDSFLSEEEADNPERLKAQRLWIIDPIDGTSSYINQRNEWALQIALVINGQLIFGALGFPQHQRMYYGIIGQGAWRLELEHGQEELCTIQKPETPILLCSRSKRNKEAMEHAKDILHEYSYDSVSSVGLKTAYLIEGKGSVYVNPAPINEWDYAAPAAVLIAAGGHATDFDNQALPLNQQKPQCRGIIFSNSSAHQNIVTRLQAMRQ